MLSKRLTRAMAFLTVGLSVPLSLGLQLRSAPEWMRGLPFMWLFVLAAVAVWVQPFLAIWQGVIVIRSVLNKEVSRETWTWHIVPLAFAVAAFGVLLVAWYLGPTEVN